MAIRKHTFTLLNKKYGLDIPDQLEEVYRLGERRLNAQVRELMLEKIDGYNDRDYLARVALDLAVELLCLETEKSLDPETDNLVALIEKIDSTLK